LKSFRTFINEYSEIIVALVFLFIIVIYVEQKRRYISSIGVVTIAKMNRLESAESGSDLYFDIYLDGTVFHAQTGGECGKEVLGKYLFVRVNRSAPTDYPLIYCDQFVPDCILESQIEYHGWDSIPTCR
jgi:hypothetical protein